VLEDNALEMMSFCEITNLEQHSLILKCLGLACVYTILYNIPLEILRYIKNLVYTYCVITRSQVVPDL